MCAQKLYAWYNYEIWLHSVLCLYIELSYIYSRTFAVVTLSAVGNALTNYQKTISLSDLTIVFVHRDTFCYFQIFLIVESYLP